MVRVEYCCRWVCRWNRTLVRRDLSLQDLSSGVATLQVEEAPNLFGSGSAVDAVEGQSPLTAQIAGVAQTLEIHPLQFSMVRRFLQVTSW